MTKDADWDDVSKEVGKAVKDARDAGRTDDKDAAVKKVRKDYKDATGKDAK